MDVPVITQLQFQQFFVEYVEVPSASVPRQCGGAVASQRQGRTVQTVQKTVEFLQVQLLDKVDMPVVVPRQVRWFDGAENSGSTASAVL